MRAFQEERLREERVEFRGRHRWLKWAGGAAAAVAVGLGIGLWVAVHRAEPFMRTRLLEALGEHFHARVELDSFHLTVGKGIEAEGKGLRIWPPASLQGVTDPGVSGAGDPLIKVDEFRFRAPLRYKLGAPVRISKVELKGVEVHLPPSSHLSHGAAQNGEGDVGINFVVDGVECEGAKLVLETSKPGKLPMEISIAKFELKGANGKEIEPGAPVRFVAELTSPKPVGTVHSTGTFGPWVVSDPGESAVQGTYTFDHADLASFKGIAGILSSTGGYEGTLRELTVDGETDTPDFRLTHFGNALGLHTRFHAMVDATNGDTRLEPVDATLGRSHFVATGQVVRVPDPAAPKDHPASKGHDIALDVTVDGGHIEDFLRLASHGGNPLLTGVLKMQATVHIPPGSEPVHERLGLKGKFNLEDAAFSSTKIQDYITELSLRGQGRPREVKAADPNAVRSTMNGDFAMAQGVITLPEMEYTVPGAAIDLQGTYGVEGGALNFQGKAKLDATVSQLVGGVVGELLKPADRFFKKDGAGTEIPVRISGTEKDPEVGATIAGVKVSAAVRH